MKNGRRNQRLPPFNPMKLLANEKRVIRVGNDLFQMKIELYLFATASGDSWEREFDISTSNKNESENSASTVTITKPTTDNEIDDEWESWS